MILYFANRDAEVMGQATSMLSLGYKVIEDLKTEDIDTGVASLSCTISYKDGERELLEEMTMAGNYIFKSEDGDGAGNGSVSEFYTIIESEFDVREQKAILYAEDAGLDLLNYICAAVPEKIGAKTAEGWISYFLSGYGWEVGANESGSVTKNLTWDGESTATERLASIAGSFKCELSFSFMLERFAVKHKYINLFAERGKDKGEQLRLGISIDNIVTKRSIVNLATAYLPTGGTPEGKNAPITLKGYQYTFTCPGNTYCDGGYIEVNVATGQVRCEKAMSKWRGILDTDGLLLRRFSFDTTDKKVLAGQTAAELRKYCVPEINYEVDIISLPEGTSIGDRINVIDNEGELYLSARILKLETSETEGKETATLGEYLIKDSGIADEVRDLASRFSEIAKNRYFYLWIVYSPSNEPDISDVSLTQRETDVYIGLLPNQLTELTAIKDIGDKLSGFHWSDISGSKGKNAITVKLSSSNGLIFKSSQVTTQISASVFIGDTRIVTMADLLDTFGEQVKLIWYVKGEEVSESDKRLIRDGFAFSWIATPEGDIPATAIDDAADIRCELWY